jgi:hypothetical protein
MAPPADDGPGDVLNAMEHGARQGRTIPSWNQIADFLKVIQQLRDSAGFAA